jgi:hypothetical protein
LLFRQGLLLVQLAQGAVGLADSHFRRAQGIAGLGAVGFLGLDVFFQRGDLLTDVFQVLLGGLGGVRYRCRAGQGRQQDQQRKGRLFHWN